MNVEGELSFLGKSSPLNPFKNPLRVVLWGVAPNPTCFLKKASQKLLFACGAKTIVFANGGQGESFPL